MSEDKDQNRQDEHDADEMSGNSSFWWLSDDEFIVARATERVTKIEQDNSPIFDAMQRYTKMYQGRMPVTFDSHGVTQAEHEPAVMGMTGAIPKHNLVRTAIDAWVAIIGKQRPRPKLLTSGGSWKSQMLAEDLNNFMTGALGVSSLYKAAPCALRDSAVCGLGAWRWDEHENMEARRIIPWQILVDEELCANGDAPYEVFVRTPENAKSLMAKYPGQQKELAESPRMHVDSRQIMVYEGWYMGEEGPRYIKFAGKALLEDEDFSDRRLPITFLHYSEQVAGFYGIGLAEMLIGAQMRIDEILFFIAEMQRRYVRPTMLVDGMAGAMAVTKVAGLEMDVVTLANGMKEPKVIIPPVIAPELYAEVERISERAMQEHGISSFATNSQVPTGIESGPALREVSFKNMERHNQAAMRYEDAFVESGHHIIEGYQRISKGSQKRPTVTFSDRTSVDFIEWPKINLKEMAYTIRLEASALDSMSPSSRTQTVLEMAQYGLFSSPMELRQLLGNPDLEASDRFSPSSFVKDAYWTINQLMKGWELTPDPTQQLSEVIPRVRAAIRETVRRGTKQNGQMDPDAELAFNNLNRFLDEAVALEQQAAAAVAQVSGALTAPQGQPPGQAPTDEGMPVANISRPAAQGLNAPSSGGGKSSQGI